MEMLRTSQTMKMNTMPMKKWRKKEKMNKSLMAAKRAKRKRMKCSLKKKVKRRWRMMILYLMKMALQLQRLYPYNLMLLIMSTERAAQKSLISTLMIMTALRTTMTQMN